MTFKGSNSSRGDQIMIKIQGIEAIVITRTSSIKGGPGLNRINMIIQENHLDKIRIRIIMTILITRIREVGCSLNIEDLRKTITKGHRKIITNSNLVIITTRATDTTEITTMVIHHRISNTKEDLLNTITNMTPDKIVKWREVILIMLNNLKWSWLCPQIGNLVTL